MPDQVAWSSNFYQRLPFASKAIAKARAVRPEERKKSAEREALFHSPEKMPEAVAVAIINICMSPHPMEVPSGPRKDEARLYSANAPIQRKPIRSGQLESFPGNRKSESVRFFQSR